MKLSVKVSCEKTYKTAAANYTKIKDSPMMNENFENKDYIQNMKLSDARTMFHLRSKMINCKYNFKSSPENEQKLWQCDSCQRQIETQSHMMSCPAYENFRSDKDLNCDEDLVKYFKQVLQVRDNLNLLK